MDDPWSTPWAVDDTSATTASASSGPPPPTTPKPAATFAPLPGAGGASTPAEGGSRLELGGGFGGFDDSPWAGASAAATTTTINSFDTSRDDDDNDDEEGWGGWDDGKKNAWTGRAEDAAAPVVFRERPLDDGFSPPWGLPDQEKDSGADARREELVHQADTKVRFGGEGEARHVPAVAAADGDSKKDAATLLQDERDAWTAPRKSAETPPQQTTAEDAIVVPALLASEPVQVEDPTMTEDAGGQPASQRDDREEDSQADPDAHKQLQQRTSKVQELVDMYDGIAKKAVRPPREGVARDSMLTRSAETSQEDLSTQTSVGSENCDVDKGSSSDEEGEGTEEATFSTEAETSSKEDFGALEAVPPRIDDANNEEAKPVLVEAARFTSNDKAIPHFKYDEQPQATITKSTTKHPPYPIDLSNLDDLFPSSTASTTCPEPVPDVIIDSSCTTTSERKTWYRISRAGSARRHDSGGGDDENQDYRRVTWAASEVRTKTLHIVRRWMEQDSIAGRVVLGSRKAGPLGASMFNWDSSEPAVEISELLRQRVQNGGGHHHHARNRSLPSRADDDDDDDDDTAPRTPVTATATGSFGGWTTAGVSVQSTPSVVVYSPAFAAAPSKKTGAVGLTQPPPPDSPPPPDEMPRSPWEDDEQEQRVEKKTITELMPPPPVLLNAGAAVVASSRELTRLETEAQTTRLDEADDDDDNYDDDDDWGEMISSPPVDSSTAVAALSAPAELTKTPLPRSFDESHEGPNALGVFVASAMTRAKPPPPIRTAGVTTSAAPSPIWTPSMSSPALEPMRASVDSTRIKPGAGTPTLASTPVLEAPRASMTSSRMSMEHAWTPPVSTPTADYRTSMEAAGAHSAATPPTNHGAYKPSMESAWTQQTARAVSPSTPPITSTKQPASRGAVPFEDSCTPDERGMIDEALKGIPDLSYMLR
ncbi:hypothetical protein V2A60_007364 [Cordyceps javanica]|uniref:Glucan 1, 4-alpha-glucosidase n=1 Tax=Cordyceps javanica TaxID=43265 RepID=A0A545W875_9HYPO|nr:glucan 1, 4-alpha-glucosidase [Cordyceps javanica]TQW10148.1 glucan 1, 4-alpha-glucosidase [Cordyceps javanica]